jgi:hypothetical protein
MRGRRIHCLYNLSRFMSILIGDSCAHAMRAYAFAWERQTNIRADFGWGRWAATDGTHIGVAVASRGRFAKRCRWFIHHLRVSSGRAVCRRRAPCEPHRLRIRSVSSNGPSAVSVVRTMSFPNLNPLPVRRRLGLEGSRQIVVALLRKQRDRGHHDGDGHSAAGLLPVLERFDRLVGITTVPFFFVANTTSVGL